MLKDDSTQRTIETREWRRVYDDAKGCKCKAGELGQYAVDKKNGTNIIPSKQLGEI